MAALHNNVLRDDMKIKKTVTFEAAHRLPFHSHMHGHSYVATVTLKGEPGVSGVVVPFGEIEKTIKEHLDHTCLNAIIDDPTMENTALYIQSLFPGSKVLLRRPSCGEEVEL